jgi:hypothetical protein
MWRIVKEGKLLRFSFARPILPFYQLTDLDRDVGGKVVVPSQKDAFCIEIVVVESVFRTGGARACWWPTFTATVRGFEASRRSGYVQYCGFILSLANPVERIQPS